ncbi:MAG: hypothetical protein KDA41_20230 [Planctomycetales bacterium]|nr:hypothetical protein [Planctomycetales bacterium]
MAELAAALGWMMIASWQPVVVAVSVAWAGVYVAVRAWGSLASPGGRCGDCTGCGPAQAQPAAKQLVALGADFARPGAQRDDLREQK